MGAHSIREAGCLTAAGVNCEAGVWAAAASGCLLFGRHGGQAIADRLDGGGERIREHVEHLRVRLEFRHGRLELLGAIDVLASASRVSSFDESLRSPAELMK